MSMFPRIMNTLFVQALTRKYPKLKINTGRKNGYSVYINNYSQRWIMVDMNDNENTSHLFLCIIVTLANLQLKKYVP